MKSPLGKLRQKEKYVSTAAQEQRTRENGEARVASSGA